MTETKIRPRHPEKARNPENEVLRKPKWIRAKAPMGKGFKETEKLMRKMSLTTVCEEAACPNRGECWTQKHAAFMIMGDTCTRACAFCNVITGKPDELDVLEPSRVAMTVQKMGLKHVVITSVDRDDLKDGGAAHFVATIEQLRKRAPEVTIEILTPDFKGKLGAVAKVAAAKPDVFNHNLETIPRLYPTIRPGARYFTSLQLLAEAKRTVPNIFTKSGIMVGLGETMEEVFQVMDDLRAADVDFLTIGQYLAPTRKHAPVKKFITPEEFEIYEKRAKSKGFLLVAASPMTRSSYHAGDDFERLKAAREKGGA